MNLSIGNKRKDGKYPATFSYSGKTFTKILSRDAAVVAIDETINSTSDTFTAPVELLA